MRTFICPHCGHTERARAASAVWHPCPLRRDKVGRPQMVEMVGGQQ